MIQNIKEITPLIGGGILIFMGALIWAIRQVYSFLNKEFVTQIECEKCRNKVKAEILVDSNNKYKEVQQQIQKNHDEWTKEIKDIRKEAAERAAILARIDGKLDTLLGDRR